MGHKPTTKRDWSRYGRTTVRIAEREHRIAKIAAAHEGVPLQDWIGRAIEGRIQALGLGALLEPPKTLAAKLSKVKG